MKLDLGEMLRKTRKEKGVSISELAKKTGYTKSFISQVERNKTSPSINSLMKLASALEIRLTDLFREDEIRKNVLIKKEKRVFYHNKRARLTIELLFTRFPDQKMEPIYFHFNPEGKTDIITI